MMLAALLLALTPVSALAAPVAAFDEAGPEAAPYDPAADAAADVDTAFARARANGQLVLVVLGGNWCHDSRALAGWFATPRFQAMLTERYELVFVDVGHRDRNLALAASLGMPAFPGTPTVLILDADRRLLNAEDAPRWRNAASRKGDAIYRHFARFRAPDAPR